MYLGELPTTSIYSPRQIAVRASNEAIKAAIQKAAAEGKVIDNIGALKMATYEAALKQATAGGLDPRAPAIELPTFTTSAMVPAASPVASVVPAASPVTPTVPDTPTVPAAPPVVPAASPVVPDTAQAQAIAPAPVVLPAQPPIIIMGSPNAPLYDPATVDAGMTEEPKTALNMNTLLLAGSLLLAFLKLRK